MKPTIYFTIIVITAFGLTGCGTTQPQVSLEPVVVRVDEQSDSTSRFRIAERQRDVWIAPQALDHDTLLHEQIVTFVERPQCWQLPTTVEPAFKSDPSLPLEPGEYDATLIRKQQEIISETQTEMHKITQEIDALKAEKSMALAKKGEELSKLTQTLKATQRDLAVAKERLSDIETAEKQRKEAEAAKPKKKWWQVW
jgi:hypothetical protein